MDSLTPTRLREVLYYHPGSGDFIWLVSQRGGCSVGQQAGTLTKNGYVQIKIGGRFYLAHRLAWFYVYETWPTQIDHKDRNRTNNAFDNLRLASPSENSVNHQPRSNIFGLTGVYRNNKRFGAQITHRRRQIYLGTFDTPEAAHRAYREKAKELFGEFVPR